MTQSDADFLRKINEEWEKAKEKEKEKEKAALAALKKFPPEQQVEILYKAVKDLSRVIKRLRRQLSLNEEERDEAVERLLQRRRVSSGTVECRRRKGEIHPAVVLIYDDDTRKVVCDEECSDCPYES